MGSCIGTTNSFLLDNHLWQDRTIYWDQPKSTLAPRSGETIIKKYENIEDVKGENGLGCLIISNLRIIWIANYNQKLNISIGLGNVSYIHYNMTDSPAFGRIRSPHIMTQLGQSRFEFSFASRAEVSMPLFSDLDIAFRYKATRVFRDLILRDGQLMKDGDALIYHGECLLRKFPNCENITTDEKFHGCLYITDRRIIWNSTTSENINVSVPYIQCKSVGTRTSSFGTALVIETIQATGGYVLGFKLHNQSSLSEAKVLVSHYFHSRKVDPFFGPLDGSVQYIDDRLVVVAENQPESPMIIMNDKSDEPENSIQQQSSVLTDCSTDINLLPPSPRSPFSACYYVSSNPEVECIHEHGDEESNENGSVHTEGCLLEIRESIALKEPLNLRDTNHPLYNIRYGIRPDAVPLLIGVQSGKASVVYNPGGQNEAELMLSLSPSSKKYRAPACVICMATSTEAAFDPCGHLCSCMQCASKLRHCPICRSEVDKLLRIYLHAA